MTKSRLSRRDFLKLAGVLPVSLGLPGLVRGEGEGRRNVLVVVFDALTASNMSLYGYGRRTTPNIDRLARRAVVYHNHYAVGNYTTPGTASLLTGVYPWTHRALQIDNDTISRFTTRNIFSVFADYHRVAYSHNILVNTLFRQFHKHIDELIPWAQLLLRSYLGMVGSAFGNDQDIATVWGARGVRMGDDGYAYSLYLAHLYKALRGGEVPQKLLKAFPRGLPTTGTDSDFLLEQAIEWTASLLTTLPNPFLGYFHFFPPHGPYNTSREFFNRFNGDRYEAPEKPISHLDVNWQTNYSQEYRKEYDEFVLYVDQQFKRFFDELTASGLLENTWLIVTSDHGEMFERGVRGHGVNTLYQPVVRIPLLIFEPGREVGINIHSPTSAVDVLPTLAHLTGYGVPEWMEGNVLPPYSNETNENRNLYMVQSEKTRRGDPLHRASAAMIKDPYKIHYYYGYTDLGVSELVQLYDVQEDPEELVDLSKLKRGLMVELLEGLKAKIREADQPYQ